MKKKIVKKRVKNSYKYYKELRQREIEIWVKKIDKLLLSLFTPANKKK